MNLTYAEAQSFLESQGVSLPDFVVQIFLEEVNSIDECLALNYSVGAAKLIKLYVLTLLSAANSSMYLSSRSAPNGASQSFRFRSEKDTWNATMSLLRALDKNGCANGLLPESPFDTLSGAFFVVTPDGCGCE